MIIYALAVFAFSSWCVFSHKFNDGIVAKHLLSLAAISAFIVIIDKCNVTAAISAGALLASAMGIWAIKHRKELFPYPPLKPPPAIRR